MANQKSALLAACIGAMKLKILLLLFGFHDNGHEQGRSYKYYPAAAWAPWRAWCLAWLARCSAPATPPAPGPGTRTLTWCSGPGRPWPSCWTAAPRTSTPRSCRRRCRAPGSPASPRTLPRPRAQIQQVPTEKYPRTIYPLVLQFHLHKNI